MPQISTNPTELILQPAPTAKPAEASGEFADRLSAAAQEADKPRAPRGEARKEPEAAEVKQQDADVKADVERDGQSAEQHAEASSQDEDNTEAPVVVEIVVAVQQDSVEISEEFVVADAVLPLDGETTQQDADASAEADAAVEPAEQTPPAETGLSEEALPAEVDAEGDVDAKQATEEEPVSAAPRLQETTAVVDAEQQSGVKAADESETPAASTESSEPKSQSTKTGAAEDADSAGQQPVGQAKEDRRADDDSQREAGEQKTPRETGKSSPTPDLQDAAAELTTDPISDSTREEIEPTTHTSEAKADRTEPPAPRSLDRIASGKLQPARSSEAPGESQAARVDASRFVSRVSRAFESAHARGDTVRLRLSPPELGAMQIKLSISHEGAMHASVETETTAARSVLLDNLPALRERLAQMEIRVEKFDVNVQQDGAGGQDWQAGDGDRRGESQRGAREAGAQREDASPTAASDAKPTTHVIGPDQINLVA